MSMAPTDRARMSMYLRQRKGLSKVVSRSSRDVPVFKDEQRVAGTTGKEAKMLLLVLLAILAIAAFGVGFTIHWLFVVAVVAALLWLISLFLGGVGGRTRRTWW